MPQFLRTMPPSRLQHLIVVAILMSATAFSEHARGDGDDSTTTNPAPDKKKARNSPARPRSDNAAGLPWRPGHKPVQLWPPAEKREGAIASAGKAISMGQWTYRSERAATAADGVPWRLIVTPSAEFESKWQNGGSDQPALTVQAARAAIGDTRDEATIPVIEMPEIVWKQRMAADLQNVVGIHFHEFVSNDVARILYTIHKVPADGPDGSPVNGTYEGQAGTRIEATLMTPVIWSLDQSIVVRIDNERTPSKDEREQQTQFRVAHELGHAGVSLDAMLEVIAGPQTWDLKYCKGRRSVFEYYWKRELVGREWDGYRASSGAKIATLRTSIAVVPPTRWSMLLPIPPQRVTQKHLQQFNDLIALIGPQLVAADKAAQEKFHAHHGEFDAPVGP